MLQGAASTARASGQKTKAQATASARVAKKQATSKAAGAKAASNVKSGTKQQTASVSAGKTPSILPEVVETLRSKARPAGNNSRQALSFRVANQRETLHGCLVGNAAAETAQSAAAANTVESAGQPATDHMPPQDHQKPNTVVAPGGPADAQAKVAPSKGRTVSHGSVLPKHMTKGIQINSPGPAYKAPGLKRPQGGKPLHQIQPRT